MALMAQQKPRNSFQTQPDYSHFKRKVSARKKRIFFFFWSVAPPSTKPPINKSRFGHPGCQEPLSCSFKRY